MSDEIIKLDGIDGVSVYVSDQAINERLIRMDFARSIQRVENGSENQAALSDAESCEKLLNRSRRSADRAKLQLLQLIRQVEDVHLTFTRGFENEMHRLRNLSGAYNAAKEQAERKDNVV